MKICLQHNYIYIPQDVMEYGKKTSVRAVRHALQGEWIAHGTWQQAKKMSYTSRMISYVALRSDGGWYLSYCALGSG
jgi:hypothetical protein